MTLNSLEVKKMLQKLIYSFFCLQNFQNSEILLEWIEHQLQKQAQTLILITYDGSSLGK
jgi:hypothetical protein